MTYRTTWARTKMDENDCLSSVSIPIEMVIFVFVVQKWISQSLKSLNEEQSSRRFKEHDQDDDGRLGWEEYLKSFYGEETIWRMTYIRI